MTSREPVDETEEALAPATPGAQALPTSAADDYDDEKDKPDD